MNCFQLSFNLIFLYISLRSCINLSADAFRWISRPSSEKFEHVGSTVYIIWHYYCDHSGISTIMYGGQEIARRFTSEKNYSFITNVSAHFSVIGGSNVTIMISDVNKDKSGPYCCQVICAREKFKKACTMLFVYALPRINYLTTSNLFGKQGDSITLRCNASGYPAPRVTWIHNDTKRTIANSSVTSFNITGKASVGKYCCHVSNDFGEETNCSSIEVLEYQPIDTELRSQINCTTANKTFKILCKADASPSVQYFIQQGNKTMVNSSDGNATITTSENGYLNFSCSAKNKYGQGKTAHLEIPICRDNFEDNDDDGSILPHDNRLQIIIVIIVCSLLFAVALILVYVLISRKRKRSKRDVVSGKQQQDRWANQWAEECPYGEPVDAIPVRSVIHASASNADYATVEETGYKRVTTSKTVQQPTHDETSSSKKVKSNVEPVYAIVNKNKKKDKLANVPLNSLNDEIPADLSNPKHPSINHPDPITSDNKNSNEEEDGVDCGDQGGSWLPWSY